MQFHPFARRLLALVLTAAFMTTAALSGFAVYAMPIQAAYPQESIYCGHSCSITKAARFQRRLLRERDKNRGKLTDY